MSTDLLLPTPPAPPIADALGPIRNLLSLWLSQLAENTRQSYLCSLKDFAGFLGASSVEDAAQRFLGAGRGPAKAVALAYKANLMNARQRSPATVNLRLGALKSMAKAAEDLGVTTWTLSVKLCRVQPFRDTKGPGRDVVRAMLRVAGGLIQPEWRRARDVAIIRLLFDLGLRCCEVSRLDIEDVDLEHGRLAVRGKGRLEKSWLTVPKPTQWALRRWVAKRHEGPGALFTSRKGSGQRERRRLTTRGLWNLVHSVGQDVGVWTSPHRIRHTAVTTAVEKTDLVSAQKFARHSSPTTTMIYVDRLEDRQGKVAAKVACALDKDSPEARRVRKAKLRAKARAAAD